MDERYTEKGGVETGMGSWMRGDVSLPLFWKTYARFVNIALWSKASDQFSTHATSKVCTCY